MAKPTRKTYFVHRPGVTAVGHTRVEDQNGAPVVRLNEAEAQYWIDQGVIGEEPHKAENDGGLMRKPTEEDNAPKPDKAPKPDEPARPRGRHVGPGAGVAD